MIIYILDYLHYLHADDCLHYELLEHSDHGPDSNITMIDLPGRWPLDVIALEKAISAFGIFG